MRYVAIGIAWLVLCTVVLAQTAIVKGWYLEDDSGGSYQAQLDRGVTHTGRASLTVRSLQSSSAGRYCALTQGIDARLYRGQRLRMSAFLRSQIAAQQGWAGLWLRVDPRVGQPLAFENMQSRPIRGNTDWSSYVIELPVAEEADKIYFGAILVGSGQIWVDDFQVESLGKSLAGDHLKLRLRNLPTRPLNLDFEL